MAAVIESADYAETRKRLQADPIIRDMAEELREPTGDYLHQFVYPDGSPSWTFMSRACDEYHVRGGSIPTHIGGPAEAVLAILRGEA